MPKRVPPAASGPRLKASRRSRVKMETSEGVARSAHSIRGAGRRTVRQSPPSDADESPPEALRRRSLARLDSTRTPTSARIFRETWWTRATASSERTRRTGLTWLMTPNVARRGRGCQPFRLFPFRQPLGQEVRQGEGGPVDIGIEILQAIGDVESPDFARIDLVRQEIVAPHADRVRRHGPEVERRVAEDLLQEDALPGVRIQGEHERAGLRGDDAAGVELGLELPVERFLMEDGRRPDRVRGVDENDVERLPDLVDEHVAVGDHELGPRVAECRVQPGEVFAAGLDDLAVDLDEPGRLDRVLEDLAKSPAVAAADDQDLGRPPVGSHGRVDQHLVVIELVALGRLDETVDEENAAVVLVTDDLDPLEL